MPPLIKLLPDGRLLLELEPEELAGYLLEHLNSLDAREIQRGLNIHNRLLPVHLHEYPPELREEISRALVEAWIWLEREVLIAPVAGATAGDWRRITRRGERLKLHTDVESFRKASILPRGVLHPQIAAAVTSDFVRGEYESAVLKAFREVEIAVRAAGGYADTDLGVPLMRKAYNPETGLLTDGTVPSGERQARMDLFAGAIGSFKNPSSHRRVDLEAEETAELIMLASHLLRIVDDRPFRGVIA